MIRSDDRRSVGVWLSWLALALVVVGLAEAAAVAWATQQAGARTVASALRGMVADAGAGVPLPGALWAGVILTACTSSVRLWARYVVSIAAILGAGVASAVSLVALREVVVAEPLGPTHLQLAALAVAPVLLAAWSVADVLHRRSRALASARPAPALQIVPTSPSTPVAGPPVQGAGWAVAAGSDWSVTSSPWPRADDDPDGTLVRPPIRRRVR